MTIFYISPSVMPSRSANSIHVARMCDAFSSMGHKVTLFLSRSIRKKTGLRALIESYYGVHLENVELVSFFSRVPYAVNVRIALLSVPGCLRRMRIGYPPDVIISRNLYAGYFLSRRLPAPLIFETHQLEYGLRKRMQRVTIQAPGVTTVVISEALLRYLEEHHRSNFNGIRVLYDAAPAGIRLMSRSERLAAREESMCNIPVDPHAFVAGYFGSLHEGRGIELLQELSERHPDVTFLIYGGDETQIRALKRKEGPANMMIMGYIEPSKVLDIAGLMDVLLMPYQKMVWISRMRRGETSRWMSPMKMFEYMAAGVPIIASRLPVLQEVLQEGYNCLMAEADDVVEWSQCLERLLYEDELRETLATNAHQQYLRGWDWPTRAGRLIDGLSLS